MPSLRKLLKRSPKKRRSSSLRAPQKKGVCIKIFTLNPKKPNSAVRKVARVRLSNKKLVTAFIPGEGHQLQEHSVVLVQNRRPSDVPRVNHRIIRGKFDSTPVDRKTARSKFGMKKPN